MNKLKKSVLSIILAVSFAMTNISVFAAESRTEKYDEPPVAQETESMNDFAELSEVSAAPTSVPTQSPEETTEPTTEPTPMPLNEEIDTLAANIDVGEKDESYTGDINIYTTYGTLPTLYALLSVYKEIDDAAAENREPAKSYMWYLRGNTANAEKLPENVTIMDELTPAEDYTAENGKTFMAYARKLFATYPNAHFNLYCDDLRAQEEITLFAYNGIPEAQYNVYLLSDGTGSYSFIKKYFYKDSAADDVEPVENAKDKWNWYEYWYNEYKKRAKNGVIDTGRFLDNNMGACYIMYAASSMDNIQYYLQWPELMISDDPSINEYLGTKMHRTKLFPSDIYGSLTEESQNKFLEAVLSVSGLTKEEYDSTYLPGIKDGKKYMIISGTSPTGEGSSAAFEARVNSVMEYFGDEYTYLYKPHPKYAAASVEGREDYLKSKGIVELPAQTPMEVILTAYPEVDLGGYNSSLYMSAMGEHVKFFFTGSFSSLSAPLPDLYNAGMYPDAILFNPEPLIPEISYSAEDGIVTVLNPGALPTGAVLIAASYSESGELEMRRIYNVTADNYKFYVSDEFYYTDNIKFMLWNNLEDMKPLAEPVSITKAAEDNSTAVTFAVVDSVSEKTNDSGEKCCEITLFNDKDKSVYLTDTTDEAYLQFKHGDAIVFRTNDENEITKAELLFSVDSISDYNDFMINERDAWAKDYKNNIIEWKNNDDIDIVFGPVFDRTNEYVMIAGFKDLKSEASGSKDMIDDYALEDYYYCNDVDIFLYDFNNEPGNNIEVASKSAVHKTPIPHAYRDETYDFIDCNKADAFLDFQIALAVVMDYDIQYLYLINPKEN